MRIKIIFDRLDVEDFVADLADNFSEEKFEDAYAEFMAELDKIDFSRMIERGIEQLSIEPSHYISTAEIIVEGVDIPSQIDF